MLLIAFGVGVCAYGELNLVVKGVVQQLLALAFEVSRALPSRAACASLRFRCSSAIACCCTFSGGMLRLRGFSSSWRARGLAR